MAITNQQELDTVWLKLTFMGGLLAEAEKEEREKIRLDMDELEKDIQDYVDERNRINREKYLQNER